MPLPAGDRLQGVQIRTRLSAQKPLQDRGFGFTRQVSYSPSFGQVLA
jgi:hypothetical protein